MAIDTRQKRFSIMNFVARGAQGPTAVPLFEPDGAIDLDDRQHMLGFYSGIAFGAIGATTVFPDASAIPIVATISPTIRFGVTPSTSAVSLNAVGPLLSMRPNPSITSIPIVAMQVALQQPGALITTPVLPILLPLVSPGILVSYHVRPDPAVIPIVSLFITETWRVNPTPVLVPIIASSPVIAYSIGAHGHQLHINNTGVVIETFSDLSAYTKVYIVIEYT